MDAFSYLSVLLSIILGLAITQVLQGVRGLLLARRHVRMYLPTLLWAGMILVMAVQMWWASFGLANHSEWTFAQFGMVLVQITLLYMLAALVLPDIAIEGSTDLRGHYYRETRPFFGILVAIMLTSLGKDLLIDGHLPIGENFAFHIAFIAVGTAAAISKHPRLHEVGSVVVAVMLGAYIALLFARLG